MYTTISVGKPSNNAGIGGGKKDRITIYDLEDIQTFPARDSKGIVITDNIVCKAGKYGISVYATVKNIGSAVATEGEPDSMSFKQSLSFAHPGNSVEIREFLQNFLNRNVIAVTEDCGTGAKTLFGSPCAPLQIKSTTTENDTMRKQDIVLEASIPSALLPADYRGTITYDAPLATIAAGDLTPSVALGSGQYQLTQNVAATVITDLTNPAHGGVYTLLGSGGSNPSSIASGGNFLLTNGTAWSAISGSQITFKAFKDGASTYKFVEQSRV